MFVAKKYTIYYFADTKYRLLVYSSVITIHKYPHVKNEILYFCGL